jgi:ABC-type microcin C transport system duplicated ATPase subunit YejF
MDSNSSGAGAEVLFGGTQSFMTETSDKDIKSREKMKFPSNETVMSLTEEDVKVVDHDYDSPSPRAKVNEIVAEEKVVKNMKANTDAEVSKVEAEPVSNSSAPPKTCCSIQ